jgi:hypothetical protein
MANAKHSDQTVSDGIHIVNAFEYADQTARIGATGLTSADIGKVARQSDTGTFWVLADDSPLTWSQIDSQNLPALSTGSGNPNSGGGTAGAIGDRYIDTTNEIPYVNVTGTNTGWIVM